MKTQDIKNMGLAYLQVLDEALKGGQKKLDMDKDGDIDAKDFAHMRKKKANENDEVEINPKMKTKKKADAEMAAEAKLDEISKDTLQKYHKKTQDYMKTAVKKDDPEMLKNYGKRLTGSGRANDRLKKMGEATADAEMAAEAKIDEISKDKVGRYIKKAMVSTADAGMDTASQDRDIRKKGINTFVKRRMGASDAVRKLTGKARVAATEETNEWPVYARIKENRAAHTKSATEPEAMDSKASKGEKDFKAMHKVDMQPAEIEKKGHDDASAAGRVTKPAAARNGDNKAGDKSIVNPVAGAKTS